jgi:hypothetical protein
VWHSDGRYRGDVLMKKPAGLAGHGDRLFASNEYGELWEIDATRLRVVARRRTPGRRWDNHLALA